MKAYRLDAKGYREYADAVTEYNEFWKQCTKSQGYSYGVFVAIVESGIRRVVIGTRDPNPMVSGKGTGVLITNGIEVTEGILKKSAGSSITYSSTT